MKGKSIPLDDKQIAIVGDKSVLTIESSALQTNAKPGAKSTKEKTNTVNEGSNKWAIWGDDDNWPLSTIEKGSKVSVFSRGLELSGDLHYGAGVDWFIRDTETGQHTPTFVQDWFDINNQIHFQFAAEYGKLIDMMQTYYWCPVEFILEEKSNRIYSIRALDTAYCRKEKRDDKGIINNIYFSLDFGTATPSKPDIIPVFNPIEPFKKKKFCVIFQYDTTGRNYYPEPAYFSTFKNGWIDVAIAVPKLIKYIYQNQISIKYHIYFPASYVRAICDNWDTKTEEEKKKWLAQKQQEIELRLTSAENAGKTVITLFETLEEKVTIEPIKNLLDTVKDLPNNTAAHSELLFTLGVDPALVGLNMPGGKDLNGSGGSDKRVGMSIAQSTVHREREITLFLAKLVGFFNNYPKNIYPKYKDIDISQTLDQNPTGKQTIVKG